MLLILDLSIALDCFRMLSQMRFRAIFSINQIFKSWQNYIYTVNEQEQSVGNIAFPEILPADQ